MNDILEFIDELKELQSLYHSGELRDFDFATKIQKYERTVARFEQAMEVEVNNFFRPAVSYNPVHEV
jgi:hypothetical protein